MQFTRAWAMPSANTFSIAPIGALVRRYLRGVSVDPFARNNRWATHTNDINPNTAAEHHMQASAFLKMLADAGIRADCVLFDPPYSPRQVAECYADAGLSVTMADTQSGRMMRECRDQIRRLVRPGTHVLSFGWNTVGMGVGFEQVELLAVCHGGAHNDTLCLVECCVEAQDELVLEQPACPPESPPK